PGTKVPHALGPHGELVEPRAKSGRPRGSTGSPSGLAYQAPSPFWEGLEREGRLRVGRASLEDDPWEVEAHHPVRHVDDFRDTEVAADGTEHVGVRGRQAMQLAEQVDHVGEGGLRAAHQVRADAGCDFIAL